MRTLKISFVDWAHQRHIDDEIQFNINEDEPELPQIKEYIDKTYGVDVYLQYLKGNSGQFIIQDFSQFSKERKEKWIQENQG